MITHASLAFLVFSFMFVFVNRWTSKKNSILYYWNHSFFPSQMYFFLLIAQCILQISLCQPRMQVTQMLNGLLQHMYALLDYTKHFLPARLILSHSYKVLFSKPQHF